MRRISCLLLATIASFNVASAEIRIVSIGPGIGPVGGGPPPAVLGGYTMTPFPNFDGGPDREFVESVPSPLGGSLRFNRALNRRTPGVSWPGWAPHSWIGNVYLNPVPFPLSEPIEVTLPPETRAFYIYGHGDAGGDDRIRATSQTGETITELTTAFVGARGFGFYVTEPDEVLTHVRMSVEISRLAIGEFGIAIPEPATAGLVLGGAAFLRRRGASAR